MKLWNPARVHGLDLLASYTYSKSIDQSAGLPEPVNPVNPSLSRGLSAFDLRQNFVVSFGTAVSAMPPCLVQLALRYRF